MKIILRSRYKHNFSGLTVQPLSNTFLPISNQNLNYFKLNNNLDILISDKYSYKQISRYLNELTSNNIIYNPLYENGLIARKLTSALTLTVVDSFKL